MYKDIITALDNKTLQRWYEQYRADIKRCEGGYLPWMKEAWLEFCNACRDELRARNLPYTIMMQPNINA